MSDAAALEPPCPVKKSSAFPSADSHAGERFPSENGRRLRENGRHVLLAMQEGLHGRVETAYGMTEPHAMPGMACGQGHECSPMRSKTMAAFIQEMAAAALIMARV